MLIYLYCLVLAADRFVFVYVLAGLGGSVASCLRIIKQDMAKTVSVGSSGAIFGLCGASLSELIINWTVYDDKVNKTTSHSSSSNLLLV